MSAIRTLNNYASKCNRELLDVQALHDALKEEGMTATAQFLITQYLNFLLTLNAIQQVAESEIDKTIHDLVSDATT